MREGPEDVIVVFVTAPEADAPRLARALVEARVAACVNIVPSVRSIYRYEGALHDEPESLMIVKSTRARFDALAAAIRGAHPYSVPEILALPVDAGHPPYLAWVAEGVAP